MDQTSLVENRVEIGQRFLEEFNKEFPVSTAFWLKETEESPWYLYVASEQIDESNRRAAYVEVRRSAKRLDVYFDPYWVKVVEGDHHLVQAAVALLERHSGPMGIYYRGPRFGNESIEGAYLYPLPIAAP